MWDIIKQISQGHILGTLKRQMYCLCVIQEVRNHNKTRPRVQINIMMRTNMNKERITQPA